MRSDKWNGRKRRENGMLRENEGEERESTGRRDERGRMTGRCVEEVRTFIVLL